ncbi:MAG: DNA-directed RNA polymerase subunit alpha [bacterium]|nr:DNA-directed RNA polymerase subunit alpha [bacterium]
MLTSRDLNIKIIEEKPNYGKFSMSPLPTGYGFTLGNTMRRVMLSSMKGSAITEATIKGVSHQFSSIDGIKEDMVEIAMNLKSIKVKSISQGSAKLKISKKGVGVITAADIEINADVQIVNKDQVIATLTKDKSSFEVELLVENGEGFSPVESREISKVGAMLIDAIFSPVINVAYTVVPTRVGRQGGLDELIFEIDTDGTITAEEALVESAGILRKFFSKINDGPDEIEEVEVSDESQAELDSNEDSSLQVEELDLPTRTINALKKAKINTVKELLNREFDELSAIKGLGEKSVEDIKKVLDKMNITK